MKAHNASGLSNSNQQKKQPLLPSHFKSQPSSQQIDVVNLVTKQQQSRVTQVNINVYQSAKKERRQDKIYQQIVYQPKDEEEEQQSVKDNKPAVKEQKFNQNRLTQHQSFLSNYSSNIFVGFLLYFAFVLLISAQVLASTYFATNCSTGQFCKTRGILLILSAELFYYLLVRFLNNRTKYRLFKELSVSFSFKKILCADKFCTFYKDQRNFFAKFIFQRPYLLLSLIIATILCSQTIYCWLATQSVMLFKNQGNFLIPTIYWSNFVLPILVSNCYLNRSWDDKSFKIHILPILLLGLVLESILQSVIFILLSLFRVLYSYLHTKQELQMFHFQHIAKGFLLLVWLVVFGIQLFSEMKLQGSNLIEVGLFFIQMVIITFSFILSRIGAMLFLKEKLYRQCYTQTHLHLAFIAANIIMYATYLIFQDQKYKSHILHCILASSFLILVGLLIYFEGKQKEELKIEVNFND